MEGPCVRTRSEKLERKCWRNLVTPGCSPSSRSSYCMPLVNVPNLCSLGAHGTSSKISLSLSRITRLLPDAFSADTTRIELESTTERSAYVLSEVHRTASSVASPLIVRLRGVGYACKWVEIMKV